MKKPGSKKGASAVSIILILIIIAAICIGGYFAYYAYVKPPVSEPKTVAADSSKDLGPLVQGSLTATQTLSKDVSRKADIDTLAASMDTWKEDRGKYPEKSSCVESLAEDNPGLDQYLWSNKLPVDPDGPREIGGVECESGYYYQSFGNTGYVLWAIMENTSNGNMSKTPEGLAADISLKIPPEKSSPGAYYIADRIDFLAPETLPAAPPEPGPLTGSERTDYSMQIPYPNITDPRKFIFELKPGESAEDYIILNNTSTKPAEFILYGTDSAIDADGNISYKTMEMPQNMVGKWITFDQDKITVGPNNKQQVKFRVTIPYGIPLSEYEGGVVAELPTAIVATRYMMKVSVIVTDNPQPVVKKTFTVKVRREL